MVLFVVMAESSHLQHTRGHTEDKHERGAQGWSFPRQGEHPGVLSLPGARYLMSWGRQDWSRLY